MTTTLTVRDRDGALSHAVTSYKRFEMVDRENDVSSWSIEAEVSDAMRTLGTPGAGILVERDGRVLIGGPTTQAQRAWSEGSDALVVSGLSEDVYLWDRLVYPCAPNTAVAEAFGDEEYDTRTGAGETVMRAFVDANLGGGEFSSGALAGRALPGLTQSADSGAGLTITGSGRFQRLGDFLQELAVQAGGLRFGITDMEFWVTESEDLSQDIEFSRALNNLLAAEYERKAPTKTHIVIGGSGEAELRTFYFGEDPTASDAWKRRIESFRDQRGTEDVDEFAQIVTEELTNGAESASLKITPIELPHLRYGVDFNRGDAITAVVDGQPIVDRLRQVAITLDENGYTVTPTIESATTFGAASALQIFDRWRWLERRVSSLERVA